jgi:hypothetical protein
MIRYGLLAALITVLVPAWSYGRDLPENILACADESDDVRRLACYDREVAKSKQSDTTVLQDRPQNEDATLSERWTPEDEFGMTDELQRKTRDPEEDLSEIKASIVNITRRRSGARVFTLDNGQVWAEKSEARRLRLDRGDFVRIVSASLGSYKLYGTGKYSTRVSRIE